MLDVLNSLDQTLPKNGDQEEPAEVLKSVDFPFGNGGGQVVDLKELGEELQCTTRFYKEVLLYQKVGHLHQVASSAVILSKRHVPLLDLLELLLQSR